MALALSRNQMKTFLEYHPQVLHDLHESVPYLYTMTGTGPYNAWLDPLQWAFWETEADNAGLVRLLWDAMSQGTLPPPASGERSGDGLSTTHLA